MSAVLIVYATIEGQSRKIAEHVCDRVARLGRGARVADAANLPRDLEPDTYDATILVAPVHMDRHHQAAIHFARDNADHLQRRPAALISVSLHAANLVAGDLDQARSYVDAFAAETAWIPEATHYAAGALKFSRYDFFKRWMLRRVAQDRGLKLEAGGADDIEFTDWRALDAFVDDFLRTHAPLKT